MDRWRVDLSPDDTCAHVTVVKQSLLLSVKTGSRAALGCKSYYTETEGIVKWKQLTMSFNFPSEGRAVAEQIDDQWCLSSFERTEHMMPHFNAFLNTT